MAARLRREIEYWKQRGEDLEALVEDLGKQVKTLGGTPNLPLLPFRGVLSDRYVNDIATGQFSFKMYARWEN